MFKNWSLKTKMISAFLIGAVMLLVVGGIGYHTLRTVVGRYDIIASANLGCTVQLSRFTQRPIVHTVELLDWATGGPMPPALTGGKLREPAVVSAQAASERAVADASAPIDPNAAGIW